MLGTRLMMSTANHPQTDGQSERSLRTLIAMLRHYVSSAGDDWDDKLWAVEFAYNDAAHKVTGFTPFQADLGRDPSTPCSLLARLAERVATDGKGLPAKQRADLAKAEDFAENMRDRLGAARRALIHAQRSVELDEATKPDGMVFVAGDYVFLREDALGGAPEAGKLGPRWYPEPLRVSERVGANAYRLMVPKHWTIHPVRNVSELKPAGKLRPTPTTIGQAAATASTRVVGFTEHTGVKAMRTLRVRLAADGRTGRTTVTAIHAVRQAGYDTMSRFASREGGELPNFLGRRLSKVFADTDADEGRRPFEGIVIASDPTDLDRQFHVWYEDGDHEWIPLSALQPLLLSAPFRAPDLLMMDALTAHAQLHEARTA
jgi:hypothetical protein